MDDLSQYLELYLQTSKEYVQGLNDALLVLEKNPTDKTAIDDIFRNAHSLKSQSAAMGYESTGYLCHVVEDVFYEIKKERMQLTPELADHLFTAFDALGNSLSHIESEKHEMNLADQAEMLKKLSGVATQGAGKSQHTDSEQAATAPAPAPTAPVSDQGDQPTDETKNTEPSTPQTAPDQPAANRTQPGHSALKTIAVKVEVLDEMMNLLENLLIEGQKLKRISSALVEEHADLKDYFNASEKMLAGLQYQIMKARAVPVSLVFDHFPRAVRDLARAENKQIELVITGSDLELDRTIVDRLDEPLIHLLRNAVSHGIAGQGVITLSAERQKDYAHIRVADNGQGIAWQQIAQKAGLDSKKASPKALKEALFSGISTSETVTQISGRGVGLSAIKRMVDNFGGIIEVASETGKGTSFTLKLPLTLAIAKALLVTVNNKSFAIPTLAVERIVAIPARSIKKLAEQEAFVLDDTDIPLLRLDTKLGDLAGNAQPTKNAKPADALAVIVFENNERIGLIVDTVVETSDIVIKPIPDVLKNVSGFSGVTILSDGQTALIINPQELL